MRDLVAKMWAVDLVLVEGFERDTFPKLEIHRAANGKSLIHPEDPHSSPLPPMSHCRRRKFR